MPRDESHQHIPIPTVKKDEWKVDNKLETRVYDDILGCDVLSEDEEPMPFKPHTWNENDLKECIAHSKVVNKPEIKLEHVDLQNGEFKMGGNVIPKDFRDSDAVGDNNPTLTLWNLPDSFAGKSFSDDPNVKKFFDYKLTDMQEGQIGKLVIRKSGKLEVYIGSGKYDLEPTNLQSFSENLMEIDLDATSSTSVLGSIQNRYILNPDWDDLLS
ncbi:uncharacterized protein LOC132708786 isoform X2 [Cylas formicarius]|nr:uncharacterized protein LOC132708786 isoform X2 [Cylas formicarius]